MLQFYASKFTAVIASLEQAMGALRTESLLQVDGHDPFLRAAMKAREAIDDLDKALPDLPVSETIKKQAQRMSQSLTVERMSDSYGQERAVLLIGELAFNVVHDLSEHLCLMVTGDVRELWEQRNPVFGAVVAARFPDANPDIAAAARCLALDEWTAAVFHLMRVLEHGLRDLADRVGHTFPTPVEYQQWEAIIVNIEAAIRRTVAALPKGTSQKADDAEFYSKAASQFWHFKDAWRNHVSHARKNYDPREARAVYDSVRAFMQALAGRQP